jgi:hypothetical protein
VPLRSGVVVDLLLQSAVCPYWHQRATLRSGLPGSKSPNQDGCHWITFPWVIFLGDVSPEWFPWFGMRPSVELPAADRIRAPAQYYTLRLWRSIERSVRQ